MDKSVIPLVYAVEGCDGVGKTHFIQSMTQTLSDQGLNVKTLSTPSKELPAGEYVRSILRNKYLYRQTTLEELKKAFVASIQEVAKQILASYQEGVYNLFFLDRWWLSYLAYQFPLENLSPQQIEGIIQEALIDIFLPLGISIHTPHPFEKQLIFPKVFHFDCDLNPETLQKFCQKRLEMCQKEGSGDVHDVDNDFQVRVLKNYKRLFSVLTQSPYHLDYEKKPIPILTLGG